MMVCVGICGAYRLSLRISSGTHQLMAQPGCEDGYGRKPARRNIMKTWNRTTAALAILALGSTFSTCAVAQDGERLGARWDISLDLPVWPALSDLQPVAGGSFNNVGYGIGASGHWPVASFANSELLLGIDGSIAATESSIHGHFADMMARQLYLGGSVKWLFGDARNLSLDAGIGYHELDMAQVETEWWGTIEFEHFSESTASVFIGATWDIGAGREGKSSGLSLGLRAHFADFGTIADDSGLLPDVLGTNAGQLDGPMFLIRVAYSGR